MYYYSVHTRSVDGSNPSGATRSGKVSVYKALRPVGARFFALRERDSEKKSVMILGILFRVCSDGRPRSFDL